jgi:exonuclease VII small subunit
MEMTNGEKAAEHGSTQLFDDNYKKLTDAVHQIENMTVNNIDQLITTVEIASNAYSECIQRIDMIEKHLGNLYKN